VYSGSVEGELERRRVAEVDAVGGKRVAGCRHATCCQHVLRPSHVVGPTYRVVPATTFTANEHVYSPRIVAENKKEGKNTDSERTTNSVHMTTKG